MSKKETVLITGATSGIGKAMAFRFAAKGYPLVIHGRNEAQLTALSKELKKHSPSVKILVKDLLDEDAADYMAEKLKNNHIQVGILVQNAGFGASGPFIATDIEKELEMIQVHITFLTKFTKYISQTMAKKGKGKILLVASTAGYCPTALMSVYAATKAYVLSFGVSLREEVKPLGIGVSILCPGATATAFSKKSHMKNTLLFRLNVMSPKQVAKAAYEGLLTEKPVIVPGFLNRLEVGLSRIAPLHWTASVSKVLTRHR